MYACKKIYTICFTGLLFFVACSPQNHFRTLSFFFDGVPNPKNEDPLIGSDSLQFDSSDSSKIFAQVAHQEAYLHRPYLEKQCAGCHDQDHMGSLKVSQPELCYQCHANIDKQYVSMHGPSTGGYCTECHNPHRAKEEYLLLRSGEELCLHCHDALEVSESVFHSMSEETSCLACHNPHGTDNHLLLQTGTCYRCHDNFVDTYNIVHGPVAIGHCSVCHSTHSEGSEKLLERLDRKLCFHCHDSLRLMKDDTHSFLENTDCIECHNPHGGEDRFLFN